MTAAFAVSTWDDTQPIDLRAAIPAQLQTSIDSLLAAFASASGPEVTRYLPDDFLTILRG